MGKHARLVSTIGTEQSRVASHRVDVSLSTVADCVRLAATVHLGVLSCRAALE